MFVRSTIGVLALLVAGGHAFSPNAKSSRTSKTQLAMADRRNFLSTAAIAAGGLLLPNSAQASIFLDPAMYGDQENRVAAVDSLRERVRRAILQNPELAPSFYQLSLLDGLTYNAKTGKGGPDGGALRLALNSKNTDTYTKNLQTACNTLLEAAIALKKYTAITIPDAVAIAGAEAVQAIGGPTLSVQLGRIEGPKNTLPDISLDLFSGKADPDDVIQAFRRSGLTEREMTALLGGLLTIEKVEKTRSTEDWRQSVKPRYVERGKMGRMSDYKRLTDEDIAAMENDYDEDPDDGWYIADSFGTKKDAFGARIGGDAVEEKNFNKYLKELNDATNPKKGGKSAASAGQFGWIASVLLDQDAPASQAWLNKYASSNLSYLKDLGVSFNSITQLGAEYTGGKYENLLKNKPRKSLNDDDLKF
jgi:hypothetical protein